MSLTPRLTMIGMYNYDNTLFDNAVFPEGVNKELFVNSLLMKYGECPVIYPNIPFFKNAVNVWSLKWYDSIVRLLGTFNAEYNPLYNYDRTETEDIKETIGDVGNEKTNVMESGTTTGNKNSVDTVTYDTKDMESGTETANGTITDDGETNVNRTVTTNINETTENQVSAYNSPTYAPDNKTLKTGEDTETTEESTTNENTRETETEVTTANTKTKTGTVQDAVSETTNGTNANTRNTSQDTKNDRDREFSREVKMYGNIGVTTSQQMFKEELEIRKNVNLYDVLSEMFYREFCIYVY